MTRGDDDDDGGPPWRFLVGSACGAAWLAHVPRAHGVGGSNPPTLTFGESQRSEVGEFRAGGQSGKCGGL